MGNEYFDVSFGLNSFYAIPEVEAIFKEISTSNEKPIALDVGAGIPTYLFELKGMFDFEKFVILDEKIDFTEFIEYESNTLYKKCKSIKDCYSSYLDFLVSHKEFKKFTRFKKNQLVRNFEKDFTFYLGEKIENFDISSLPNVNSIFLLNILHFVEFEDGRKVLLELVKKLKESGVLILEVNHSENYTYTNPGYTEKIAEGIFQHNVKGDLAYLYSDNRFIELIELLDKERIKPIVKPKKNVNRNNGKGNSLMFIGEKR